MPPFFLEGHDPVNPKRVRFDFGRPYRLAVMGLLGIALAVAGGASRADEDQQLFVRLAAVAALAASLWPVEFGALRRGRAILLGLAAAYLLLVLQMVPLPPGLWAALPGHGIYARIAAEAGQTVWRPLSLTPDLTLNALYALLPATAAALGALYLDFRGRCWMAHGLVLIAATSALLGLMQLGAGDAMHLYRESNLNAPVGLFANKNHQAALLACVLPLIGASTGRLLREGANPRLIFVLAGGLVALLLLAQVSTGSRMGLLLAAIGLAGALFAYRASGCPILPRRRRMRIMVAAIAAAGLAMVALAAVKGGAIDRLLATDRVSETRVAMVGPLLATAKAYLPLGAGFGSFANIYRQFEPDALLSTIYMNQAHDEPLQLVIEGGMPALILLALFMGWWAMAGWRALRNRGSSRRRAMGIAALAITIILMVSSCVDYPLRTPLLSALFAIACVEMLRAGADDQPAPGEVISRRS